LPPESNLGVALNSNLYFAYAILSGAILIQMVIVSTCFSKYNERRLLLWGMILNLFALLVFADIRADHILSQV